MTGVQTCALPISASVKGAEVTQLAMEMLAKFDFAGLLLTGFANAVLVPPFASDNAAVREAAVRAIATVTVPALPPGAPPAAGLRGVTFPAFLDRRACSQRNARRRGSASRHRHLVLPAHRCRGRSAAAHP